MAPSTHLLQVATIAMLGVSSFVAGDRSKRDSVIDNIPQYLKEVCYPLTIAPVAPCVEITQIQRACEPKGTAPADLAAHAACLCGGSFFDDWAGCLQCLHVHGFRTDAAVTQYGKILAVVSTQLCSASPTAEFPALFRAVEATFPQLPSGKLSDLFPGDAAVSLYYTATRPQGPGTPTAAAAAAMATDGSRLVSAVSASWGSADRNGTGRLSLALAPTASPSTNVEPNAAVSQSPVGLLVYIAGAAVAAMM